MDPFGSIRTPPPGLSSHATTVDLRRKAAAGRWWRGRQAPGVVSWNYVDRSGDGHRAGEPAGRIPAPNLAPPWGGGVCSPWCRRERCRADDDPQQATITFDGQRRRLRWTNRGRLRRRPGAARAGEPDSCGSRCGGRRREHQGRATTIYVARPGPYHTWRLNTVAWRTFAARGPHVQVLQRGAGRREREAAPAPDAQTFERGGGEKVARALGWRARGRTGARTRRAASARERAPARRSS
jgi:hypothetical protein